MSNIEAGVRLLAVERQAVLRDVLQHCIRQQLLDTAKYKTLIHLGVGCGWELGPFNEMLQPQEMLSIDRIGFGDNSHRIKQMMQFQAQLEGKRPTEVRGFIVEDIEAQVRYLREQVNTYKVKHRQGDYTELRILRNYSKGPDVLNVMMHPELIADDQYKILSAIGSIIRQSALWVSVFSDRELRVLLDAFPQYTHHIERQTLKTDSDRKVPLQYTLLYLPELPREDFSQPHTQSSTPNSNCIRPRRHRRR